MGTSPENSVVDSDHRVWGVPNLFVADGSACPTQGAANPALTIMALSSRLAERLKNGSVASRTRSGSIGSAPKEIRK
jgi:choline dehydrogenase-like flavoprotein